MVNHAEREIKVICHFAVIHEPFNRGSNSLRRAQLRAGHEAGGRARRLSRAPYFVRAC